MTPEAFAYWLQGFAELNPSLEQPTPEQWKSITEHLKTVFVKVTPEVKMQPLKIDWPVGGGSADDIAKKIRDAARDGIRDSLPFGPFPGFRVREARDLLPNEIHITC
jgi:hypothetical protein